MPYCLPSGRASATSERRLRYWLTGILPILYLGFQSIAFGQTPSLITQPLPYSALCAGTQIDVTGARNNVDIDWTVELSNGGSDYYTIPSTYLSSSGRFEVTYRATIPANTVAGTNYRIRVVSKSPALAGTPSSTVLTIYAAVPAPSVTAVSYCQGFPAPSLSAVASNGGTLNWYPSATGGQSAAASPTPSTTNAGTVTYYVSQTVATGCESPRVPLPVTVNPIPAAPTVSKATYSFCQNTAADSLSASGQNLKWYEAATGGTGVKGVLPGTASVGTKSYYVSQTVTGCESARTSVTVTVLETPAAPTVSQTTYEFCQGATSATISGTISPASQTNWASYGDEPNLLSTATTGNIAFATVSTVQSRTLTYALYQTGSNGCKSPVSASITITVNPTPTAPGVQAVSICQNSPAQSLSVSGQNLVWYTGSTGGTGSTTTPLISTSQTGQTTYYVSQSLNGCESPRATLVATVKPVPPAPGVTPKTLCQFAPAELLSASGENLTWYSVDETKLGSPPLISTDRGTTFTVNVTQTVNGCESAKASLTVSVVTTPSPIVTTPLVELCQGTTAQPLSATGTSLKWIDPAGNVSANTPTPLTTTPTARPDGDVYYVTQTGTNGCESPRVAIRVFVQTVPTMSISGSTTVNLGLEVPLQLLFTGVGPYRYKLSTGLTGTATKDTTILVLPDRTTTYQVVEVTNKCGVGKAGSGASAVVAVLVPGIQTLALPSGTICAGAGLATSFMTTGAFNPGSVFRLQLAKVESDSAKINFVDVPNSQATGGRITGTIPATIAAGTYWVRVMATNPKIPVNGNISPTVLTIRPLPTASLTGNQRIFEGQPASLSVGFTGEGPWSFSYRDSTAAVSGQVQTIQASTNPYLLEVRPQKTTAYYLTAVSNGCGTGTRTNDVAIVTVVPLLGVEDPSLADAVSVYPVPATTTLTVRITGLAVIQPALIELTDLTGRPIVRYETRQPTSQLPLDQQAAGTYILRVRVGDRAASRRIVKL